MYVKNDRSASSQKKTLKKLNAKKMTPHRLKLFKGFEGITDDEAEETISMLEQFCEIICKHLTSS